MQGRRLRATTTLLALSALVGAGVLGGALAAHADDGLEFGLPLDGGTYAWTSTPFVFSGTTDSPTEDVTVFNFPGGSPDPLCSDTPDGLGNWSCAAPLAPDSYEVHAVQVGADQEDIVFFDIALPAPTYSNPDPYEVSFGGIATFSGTITYPSADVVVEATGVGSCTDTTPVDVGDAWSCSFPLGAAAEGDYAVTIRHDNGGAPAISIVRTLRIGPPLAPLAITSPVDGGTVIWEPGDFLQIQGTTDDILGGIDLELDGVPIPECSEIAPSPDGTWVCPNPILIDPGPRVLRADQGAEFDEISFDVFLPEPGLNNPDPLVVADGTPTVGLSGSSVAGTTVYANIEGRPDISCGVPTVAGTWSECDLDISSLDPGTYRIMRFQLIDTEPDVQGVIGYSDLVVALVTIDWPTDGGSITWQPDTDLTIYGSTTNLSDPLDVFLGGALVCDDIAPTTFWNCPVGPLPAPQTGLQIQVDQGPVTVTADFEVLLPHVVYSGDDPLYVPPGDDAEIGGLRSYDGTTVTALVEGQDLGCTDPNVGDSGDPWSCVLDISELPEGGYSLAIFADDDGAANAEILRIDLVIGPPPPAGGPQMTCAFRPGGVTITSPDGAHGSLYTVNPGTGGGIEQLGYCNGSPGTPVAEVGTWDDPIASCGPVCDLDLAPGVYDLYYMLSDEGEGEGEGGFEPYDYFFTIPEPPPPGTASRVGGAGLASGEGVVPGNTVVLTSIAGSVLCSAVAAESGTWSCAFPLSAASAGRAYQVDAASGGMSPYSGSFVLPVSIPPLIPVLPPVPFIPIPAVPGLPTLGLGIDWLLGFPTLDKLLPGDGFTISSSGLPVGSRVTVTMYSTPVELLSMTTTGAEAILDLTVPPGIEPGAHTIELVAIAPDGQVLTRTKPAIVVSPEIAKEAAGTDGSTFHEKNAGVGLTTGRNQPGSHNALSASIAPVARVAENPLSIAFAAGLAIALLFLVALPTELLNSTLSSNSNRLGRGFLAIEGFLNRVRDWFLRVTRSRALGAAVIVFVVSLIFGFVDPGFGFDIASVRLVLALGIAFFVLSYGASRLAGIILRRFWGADSIVEMQPSIILFAVVGVVLARVLDFSPGFLVGVVIGLELIRASRKAAIAATLVQFGLIIVLALTAWVGYSLIMAAGSPTDFGGALVRDTLAAITAEGLMAALVAVFPLRFLQGRDLFEASKALWLLCFVVIATAFALLVLPTALAGTEVGDLGVWVVVFLVFAAIAFTVWLVFARTSQARAAAHKREERVDA